MDASFAPLLAHLWQKNRPLMLQRLALLDKAAAAPGDPDLRHEAIAIAHIFTGSLAMFGFPLGTDLARTLEQGLESAKLSPDRQLALTQQLRATLFPEQP